MWVGELGTWRERKLGTGLEIWMESELAFESELMLVGEMGIWRAADWERKLVDGSEEVLVGEMEGLLGGWKASEKEGE